MLAQEYTGNRGTPMQIKSTSFSNNQAIPPAFSCTGDNISPPLGFFAVPSDAESLALWMHDPDAPSGDFNHWIVWGINPRLQTIPAGSLPTGAIEGTNDFGYAEYGGPCPPKHTGTHHYVFELFALDSSLPLPAGTPVNDALAAIRPHVLAHATLTGTLSA